MVFHVYLYSIVPSVMSGWVDINSYLHSSIPMLHFDATKHNGKRNVIFVSAYLSPLKWLNSRMHHLLVCSIAKVFEMFLKLPIILAHRLK